MNDIISKIHVQFTNRFGGKGTNYSAPGRINLIGEHTDYNNGFVFPGAVLHSIVAEIRPNGSRIVRAIAADLNDYVEFDLDSETMPEPLHYKYVYGVCREMMALGVPVQGFDCAFAGNVPLGAGMSSSAALESCFAYALNDLFYDNKIDKMELAKVGQRTEHKYVGCMCGIMDQAISCLGKAGNLLRLDCRSGEYAYFPWNPEGYELILVNSGVKHQLVGSPYNERRLQCEHVAEIIGRHHPEVKSLRDADEAMLDEVQTEISETEYNRAKYVIGEIRRVLTVCDALQKDDYKTVGEMMYETHHGLSHEYEVSCEELDFLVEIARQSGVTGSRIMGGGFGGCTINLVPTPLASSFKKAVMTRFTEKYGKQPIIIDVVIGNGAEKIL